jgi:hypothetical protein
MTPIDCTPEEFYRFNYPKLGYSILIVPHSEKDREKLTRKSKQSDLSLREFARDEIVGVLVLSAPTTKLNGRHRARIGP